MKYLFILNPKAGKGRANDLVPDIRELLDKLEMDYVIQYTEKSWQAAELAENAGENGFDVVVAAGGDGTCNEVINGLMNAKAKNKKAAVYGTIPIGRGNDFCAGADIPADWETACHTLKQGKTRNLDVGKVTGGDYPQGRYFGNGIGIGFDAMVGLAAHNFKRIHGFFAYIVGTIKIFIEFPKPPAVKIQFNDKTINLNALQISVMNGSRMGGTFFMAPQASNHDGLLDLCLLGEVTRRGLFKVITLYAEKMVHTFPGIIIDKSDKYNIIADDGGLVCHADGETICINGKNLLVECIPASLQIICDC